MRKSIQNRRAEDEFIARGLRSAEEAARSRGYHVASAVHAELQRRLDRRKKDLLK